MNKKGAFLIELLVVLGISTIIVSGVSLFASVQRESVVKSDHRQTASQLARQQLERVKALWQNDWDNLNDGTWHLELTGGSWELVANSQTDANYTKEIEIESVYRDLNGQIASEAGILDPSSKEITSTVSWQDPEPKQLQETLILTNYLHHDVWVEDSLADFSDGTEDATDYSIQPGSVVIAQTGGGGWSEPASVATADGWDDANGIASWGNYLFLALDRWPGKVQVFAIDNPELPANLGGFDTFWRVNDIAVDDNGYLYVADYTGWFWSSVSVFNVGADPTTPPYVGDFNVSWPARSIWVEGDLCFLSLTTFFFGDTNYILVYDIGDDPDNPDYLGSFQTQRSIRSVAASGNYLYAALNSDSKSVEIFDISGDPANPTSLGTFSTLYRPKGISVDGDILYLVTQNKRGAMYRLDDPTNPELLGYFPTIQYTADIVSKGDYGFVAGSDSWRDVIEVFDLADSKGVSGTYFVYGEYDSSTFQTGGVISFYRLFWEGNAPSGTEIRFQTAVNSDNSTWNFVGPDGTGASYFSESGAVYYPESLGEYMKYKIILTGDGEQTSQIDKVTVSYAD